jgi:hypothetical protein
MTQPPGMRPAPQRTPLSAEEKARAEVNFSPCVVQALVARGRFRVSADTPEMVELFQKVARRAGDMLRRPVVSFANGREIVITFGQEDPPGLTGQSALRVQDSGQRSARPSATGCRVRARRIAVVDVMELSVPITGLGPDFDPVTRTTRKATGAAARVTWAGSFSRAIALWFLVGAAGAAVLAMVLAR